MQRLVNVRAWTVVRAGAGEQLRRARPEILGSEVLRDRDRYAAEDEQQRGDDVADLDDHQALVSLFFLSILRPPISLPCFPFRHLDLTLFLSMQIQS